MSTDRRNTQSENSEDPLGILDSTGAIGTADIGLLGEATAQVPVALPVSEEDELVDDGVTDGEAFSDLILEADPAALVRDDDGVGRIHQGAGLSDIVIEIPAPAVEATVAEAEPDRDAPEIGDATQERDSGATPPRRTSVKDAEAPSVGADGDPQREDASADGAGAVGESAPHRDPVPVDDPESREPRAVRLASIRDAAERQPTEARPAVAEPRDGEGPAPTAPAPVPELAARRLDQFGDRERESADLLTADRLLDTSRLAGPEPEGMWSHLLYTISGRRINLGDGKRAQQRKALSARIAAPLPGTARFVPVLSRKGGVGKTTVTALLGMALADAREDRVIAVDANPDRGTLADRIARTNPKTVRDLVRIHDQVTGYHDISAVVSRDATRLDVLASDTDPRVSEAFNDEDYAQVASVAAHYYSLVLTDTGTGIVHSVMGATLDRADTIVIVAGLSVDEARLASETLTWLETNGYADKVRDAVVVLNQSTPGSPMVRLSELEAHFRTRVAHVLRLPYDARIAAGSAISFAELQPETRQAARELAAVVVEGLRAQAA